MTIRQWQRLGCKTFVGGLLAWSGAGTLAAQPAQPAPVAQEAAPVRRHYLNKSVVDLPITMDAAARAQIQEIHLYVKEKADAPWTLRDKGSSGLDKFRFQTPRDGEYWFTMVTIDRQGRAFPQDLQHEPAGLIVVIDTQKPVVELTKLGTSPAGQLIHCAVNDANLDDARVRFFYQSGDKQFRPLEPASDKAGVFCIPAQAVCTGLVRLVAQDLAGNQTVCEEHLSQMKMHSVPTPAPTPTQQVAVTPQTNPGTNPMGETKKPNPLPPALIQSSVAVLPTQPAPTAPEKPRETVSLRPNGSEGPHWDPKEPNEPVPAGAVPFVDISAKVASAPAPAPKNSAPAKRQIVNNTKVFLDFQIENPSRVNVSKVEVWLTRDHSKSWQKITEDDLVKSPVAVELPGDGLFGVILMVPSNRGGSTPPPAGEQPDWWIEVDTTRPTGQFTELQVTHLKGQATVHVTWAAQDKNLSDSPVDLFYGASPKGPWLPIAKGLPAEGHYDWRAPVEIGTQAHLRLIARDVVGNTGIFHTVEPINLEDPSRPRVTIRNVRPDAPSPAPVAPPPFQIIQPQN